MAEQQPEHQDKLIRGIDNTLELRVVAARCIDPSVASRQV